MHYSTRRSRGFTLIELLIVIAIIAILAAILFPVFARARENARRASCSSNVKQISLGLMQYTQDYDEKFPGWYTDPDGGGFVINTADRGWTENIQPYLKSLQLYQCPSESTTAPATGNGLGYSDYFINARIASTDPAGIAQPTAGGAALSSLDSPTLTIMAGDGGSFNSENQMSNWPYNTADPGQYRRHLSGNNFAFCDGHVKWYRPDKIKTTSVSGAEPTFAIS